MKIIVYSAVFCALAAAASVSASACGKRQRYSPTCTSNHELVSPWSELALPVSDGRVCKSDAKGIEVQFLSGTADERFEAFEKQVLAAGFTKAECVDRRCVYKRDAKRLNLMRLSADRWRTITAWMN
jgi:hypothetical protein